MDATNSNLHSADRLLTDKEVAALLGISRASVWNRVSDGTLQKPVKLGRTSRFPQSEILGFIEAAKQQRAA